ncbi:MAG: hypothetical protein DWQ01_08680 [Planctomycetota bacterium]|nr:MAG: hypothetical protein DWQ01_08680 [Planctomycetota bacterium]
MWVKLEPQEIKKMRRLFPLFLVFLFVACTSHGTEIDYDDLSWIKVGETTETELVEKFGKPDGRARNSDGTQNLSFVHVNTGFMGFGAEMEGVIITLDQNGKVQRWTHAGNEE